MASLEELVDPRIAVLIVWAIFFFVFIVLPSICLRCIGSCSSGNIEDLNDDRNPYRTGDGGYLVGGWDSYMFLSTQRRNEIDEKRSNVIRRYLGRFSIALEKDHMLCLTESGEDVVEDGGEKLVEEKSLCLEEHLPAECQDPPAAGHDMASPDDSSSCHDRTDPPKDEEVGLNDEEDLTTSKDSTVDDTTSMIHIFAPPGKLDVAIENPTKGELAEFIEVRKDSPLAGEVQVGDKIIAVDDDDVQQVSALVIYELLFHKRTNAQRKITILRGKGDNMNENSTSDEYTHVRIPYPSYDFAGAQVKEKPIPEATKQCRRFPLFQPKVQVVDNQQQDQEKQDEGAERSRRKDERRDVPHFCAICLGEYEISETISWSSNPECTHVFHQECIVKWLNTLGRKLSKYQRFSENPSATQLLNYRLQCPCCRQDFISKLVLVDEEYGDESV
ncbi:hypothetical protein ACHAXR_005503 [Thalassiosira sp. AJA248-18]